MCTLCTLWSCMRNRRSSPFCILFACFFNSKLFVGIYFEHLNLEYKNVAITAGASAPEHIVNEISNFLNPENLEYYIDTEEEEYFPLPKELRSNISSLTGLLTTMFPMNDVEPVNSISKDKSWSATEALSSL